MKADCFDVHAPLWILFDVVFDLFDGILQILIDYLNSDIGCSLFVSALFD